MQALARLLVIFLLLSLVVEPPPWRVESSSRLEPVGDGAALVIKKLTGPAKAEMRLVIFDEKRCKLRVVSNAEVLKARSLEEVGRANKALAVCNGGYFHPGKLLPSGLEIADGERAGKFETWGWVGAVVVEKDKTRLVWQEEFRDSADITQFVQCSPWLVSEGRLVPLPQGDDPRRPRTFILTDGDGHWAIGICTNVGLLELGRLLLTPNLIPEIKVHRALNLDGGPSMGLWCRHEDGRELFVKPAWLVRNMIVLEPRISK